MFECVVAPYNLVNLAYRDLRSYERFMEIEAQQLPDYSEVLFTLNVFTFPQLLCNIQKVE